MGTWEAGPFGNDEALDLRADIRDRLIEVVERFVEKPRIDEGFNEAFAALAMLRILVKEAGMQPPNAGDIERWRDVFLRCFDEQIDELEPSPASSATSARRSPTNSSGYARSLNERAVPIPSAYFSLLTKRR